MHNKVSALVFIFLLLVLAGCQPINSFMGVPSVKGNGYKITQKRGLTAGGTWVGVEYKGHSFIYQERVKNIETRMLEATKEAEALINAIPKSGFIVVDYGAHSLEGRSLPGTALWAGFEIQFSCIAITICCLALGTTLGGVPVRFETGVHSTPHPTEKRNG